MKDFFGRDCIIYSRYYTTTSNLPVICLFILYNSKWPDPPLRHKLMGVFGYSLLDIATVSSVKPEKVDFGQSGSKSSIFYVSLSL